jgi:hypothetical protein
VASKEYTLLLWASLTSSGGNTILISIPYANNVWNAPYGLFLAQNFDGGTAARLFTPLSGSADSIYTTNTGFLVQNGTLHQYAASRDPSDNTVTYFDDKQFDSGTGTNSGNIAFSTYEPITLLSQSSSSGGAGGEKAGTSPLAAVWSRVLAAGEIAELYHDPFALLTTPTTRRLFYLSHGAAGGGSVSGSATLLGSGVVGPGLLAGQGKLPPASSQAVSSGTLHSAGAIGAGLLAGQGILPAPSSQAVGSVSFKGAGALAGGLLAGVSILSASATGTVIGYATLLGSGALGAGMLAGSGTLLPPSSLALGSVSVRGSGALAGGLLAGQGLVIAGATGTVLGTATLLGAGALAGGLFAGGGLLLPPSSLAVGTVTFRGAGALGGGLLAGSGLLSANLQTTQLELALATLTARSGLSPLLTRSGSFPLIIRSGDTTLTVR